jgi:hypothetical protein
MRMSEKLKRIFGATDIANVEHADVEYRQN